MLTHPTDIEVEMAVTGGRNRIDVRHEIGDSLARANVELGNIIAGRRTHGYRYILNGFRAFLCGDDDFFDLCEHLSRRKQESNYPCGKSVLSHDLPRQCSKAEYLRTR